MEGKEDFQQVVLAQLKFLTDEMTAIRNGQREQLAELRILRTELKAATTGAVQQGDSVEGESTGDIGRETSLADYKESDGEKLPEEPVQMWKEAEVKDLRDVIYKELMNFMDSTDTYVPKEKFLTREEEDQSSKEQDLEFELESPPWKAEIRSETKKIKAKLFPNIMQRVWKSKRKKYCS